MPEPRIPTEDRRAVEYALRNKTDVQIPAADAKAVQAKVAQLNRWRAFLIEARPELNRMRFRPRFNANPPHLLIQYDHSYDMELRDGNGNPLGFTLADLAEEQDAEKEEQERQERREQEASIPPEQKWRELREIAQSLCQYVSDIIEEDDMTPAQRQALADAREQRGTLSGAEADAILHSMLPGGAEEEDSLF